MNKQALLKLNVVPEGREPWLSYENYLKLDQLFEAVDLPGGDLDDNYLALHHFLVTVAGLEVPQDAASIHLNAFILLRRGYKVEEPTPK